MNGIFALRRFCDHIKLPVAVEKRIFPAFDHDVHLSHLSMVYN